jgi:hypothetical protein
MTRVTDLMIHLQVIDLNVARAYLRVYLLNVQLPRLEKAAERASKDVGQEAALDIRR